MTLLGVSDASKGCASDVVWEGGCAQSMPHVSPKFVLGRMKHDRSSDEGEEFSCDPDGQCS